MTVYRHSPYKAPVKILLDMRCQTSQKKTGDYYNGLAYRNQIIGYELQKKNKKNKK